MKKQEVAIQITAEQADEILRDISYFQVIQTVFTNPLRGMMLACGKRAWKRGILMIFLVALLGTGIDVMLRLPNRVTECRRVAEFLGSELGNITIENGRLRYDRAVPRSVRGHFSFGRIDILKKGEKITDAMLSVTDNDPMGLMISEDQVVLWYDSGQVVPYQDRRSVNLLLDRIALLQKAGYLPVSLSPEFLEEKVPQVCYMLAPGLILVDGVRYGALVLFYALLLCMVVSSVRRTLLFFMGSAFVFAVHAVIPPFVIALVYSRCFSSLISFEPAFWLASVGYLAFAVWGARNGMNKYSGRYLIGRQE